LFLASVFNTSINFDFKKQFRIKHLVNIKIKLPIDKNNGPDWKYMEDYMKKIFNSHKNPNFKKLEELPKKIKSEEKINLSKWKKFNLTELFNYKRGKRYKKADHKEGDIAYISSSAKNNGIDNFVNPPSELTIYENCITLANSGSVGKCFYHNYKFVPSDHVHVLWLKNGKLKKEIALFLIAVIEQNKDKFMFNKEISESTIKEIEFFLPIKNDKPDWVFMENYIENMSKKIESALV